MTSGSSKSKNPHASGRLLCIGVPLGGGFGFFGAWQLRDDLRARLEEAEPAGAGDERAGLDVGQHQMTLVGPRPAGWVVRDDVGEVGGTDDPAALERIERRQVVTV